ncbi:MAG: HAD-IIIA family hydrolase [Candidatus Eisenbacteria bacterium]|nr:HAD-IIIA family hydrolase [Candidatus Eisenbacteria bacterium]
MCSGVREEAVRRGTGGGRPAAFLDRDGTLSVERGYVTDPDDLSLEPSAAGAVRRLNEAGVAAVVVSNQACVAKGLLTEEGLAAVHDRLVELLAERGAVLDGAYYAPNYNDAAIPALERDLTWRKPGTGMVEAAVRDLGLDLASSAVFGDQPTDLGLARNLGIPGVLVRTGRGEVTEREDKGPVTHVSSDIGRAVDWFLSELGVRP